MQVLLYGCNQLAPRLTERGYQVVQDSRKAEAMLYTGKVIPDAATCPPSQRSGVTRCRHVSAHSAASHTFRY